MNELPRASGPSADRSFPVLVAVASLLAIAAILAFIFLEIVPWKKPVRPSALALENEFLALERWLTLTGHPVRTEVMPGSDTIPQAGEGTVYVQASLFRWSKKNYDMLKPWVEGGGRLLVSLDREWDKEYSEGMAQFLADLGIGSDQFFGADGADDDGTDDDGTDDDGAAPETGGAEGDGSAHDDGSTDDETAMSRGPFFDYRISFDPKEIPPDCFSLSDSRGNIRLVGVKMGEGSVTLFGSPVFMTNFNLDDAPNARLAWSLTGAEDSEGKGVLFIRGRKPSSAFWGRLADSGELLPPLLSLIAVLVAGFWMVIPVFGRLFEAPPRPGKPIGERFLAEARFFRRYGALDSYIEPYRETIRQRLAKTTGSGEKPDDDYCRHLAELCGIDHTKVSEIFNPRHPGTVRPGEFVRIMETVHTILERL